MKETYYAVVYVEEGRYGAGTLYRGTLDEERTCLEGSSLALALEPHLNEQDRKIEPYKRGNLRMYIGLRWEWLDVTELADGRRLLIEKDLRPNCVVQYRCRDFTCHSDEDFARNLPELLTKMGFREDEIPSVQTLILERFGITP